MVAKRGTVSGGKSQKPIHFTPGGLHRSTHTPDDKEISPKKEAKAAAGGFGPLAKKQEQFKRNVLTGPKRGK